MPERIDVVHLGNALGGAGGISSVIEAHLARELPSVTAGHLPTYDPRAPSAFAKSRPWLHALAGLLREPRTTVLHVHISQGGSLLREGAIAVLGRTLGHGIVITIHGSSLSAAQGATRAAVSALCRVVGVVHGFSEAYRTRFNVPAERWHCIPNDVEIPEQDAAAVRRKSALFAGEVGTRKGVDVLWTAWTDNPPAGWTLEIAGPGGPDWAPPPSGHPSVEVRGPLPRAEVLARMATASIVVQPSRAEAFPVTVCEALARGCAVIGTPVGAMGELLSSAGQAVVAPADPEALAAALGDLCDDEDLLAHRSELARAYAVGHLATEVVNPQWRLAYEAAARTARRRLRRRAP